MPQTVFGLPVHPLVVHATVVLVPAAAALLLVTLVWPRVRRWAGPLPLPLALVTVALTLVTTASGKNLERRVGSSTAINEHQALGEMLIWWCLGLVVVAATPLLARWRGRTAPRPLAIALVVVGVAVCLGTIVQVALIGHSGAQAVWGG